MEALRIEILNRKAMQLIKGMQDLKLKGDRRTILESKGLPEKDEDTFFYCPKRNRNCKTCRTSKGRTLCQKINLCGWL